MINVKSDDTESDLYVAYASEDRSEVSSMIAELRRLGLRVWFDQHALVVGESLRAQMDRGLARSSFGVVVLSPAFFAKNWTSQELDGMLALEQAGEPRVLPVWHGVGQADVVAYSAMLAGRKAAVSSGLLEDVAAQLAESIFVLYVRRGNPAAIVRAQTSTLPWKGVEFFDRSLRQLNEHWFDTTPRQPAFGEPMNLPMAGMLGAKLDGRRVSVIGHQVELQHFAESGSDDEWVFQLTSIEDVNVLAYVRHRLPGSEPPPSAPNGFLTCATGYVIARGPMRTYFPDGTEAGGRNCVYVMADHVFHVPPVKI